MSRRGGRAVAAAAAALLCAGCTARPEATSPSQDSAGLRTGSVTQLDDLRLLGPRAVHRATLLEDGRVLITGGCTEAGCGGTARATAAELYDPGSGRIVTGPDMQLPRLSGTATLLGDGRVLLVGGYPGEGRPPTASAELFDPRTRQFSVTGGLATARADQSATLLDDGTVLVAGGFDDHGRALATTEVFDPSTERFHSGPTLRSPRAAHAAVRLGESVAVIGGTTSGPALGATEVLRAGRWTPGPELRQARVKHAAVALDDHRVLVIGGAPDTEGRHLLSSTEILDIAAATSVPGPVLREGQYKLDGAVGKLPDGRVVIGGGTRLELYDPATDRLRVVGSPHLARLSFRTLTVLGDGSALVAGGYDDAVVPSDAAVKVPAADLRG